MVHCRLFTPERYHRPVPARRNPTRPPRPGDVVLTGWVVLAIALLTLNDHVLKAAWPGVVTGKLSDLAGLAFFPVLLAAGWELVTRALIGRRGAVAFVVATGLVFAATKTLPAAALAWGYALGLLQWPVRALLHGGAALAPAHVVVDPTDLLALPALLAPLLLLRARASLPAPAAPT